MYDSKDQQMVLGGQAVKDVGIHYSYLAALNEYVFPRTDEIGSIETRFILGGYKLALGCQLVTILQNKNSAELQWNL